MEKKRKRIRECVYCSEPGITRDHIPPKGMFPSPRPDNLITVPACEKHNSAANHDDEFMQRYAFFTGAEKCPESIKVAQCVMRAIEYPEGKNLRAEFYSTLRKNELGQIAIRMDSERADRCMNKMIRGMLYHVTKRKLPDGYRTFSHNAAGEFGCELPIPNEIAELHSSVLYANAEKILKQPEIVLASGVYAFRYVQLDEDPNISIWSFEFYRAGRFMGYSYKPVGDKAEFPKLI